MPQTTSSTKLSFVPNTGVLSATGLNASGLTASSAVATDASKNLVSVATTGTGNYVLAASPTLTGTPLAPTATNGTNTTQIATTAFVSTLVGGTTTASSSISGNGYQKYPSGLIVQWGVGNFSSGTVAITFPITFPTSCFSVTACVGRSPTLSGYVMSLQVDRGTIATTGVTIMGNYTTGGSVGPLGNEQAQWIAFGY